MKNKIIRNNIFKGIKILSLIFVFGINNIYANTQPLKIITKCKKYDMTGGSSVAGATVSLYCEAKGSIRAEYTFTDSPNPPRHYFGTCCTKECSSLGDQKNDVYKHILPTGDIMYSESSDPYHFTGSGDSPVKVCVEWETLIDPIALLSAFPSIGQSRIDPNLIEY